TLLAAYRNGAERHWDIAAVRIDWQAPDGTTPESHAQNLLDPTAYETGMSYDALNRIKSLLYPQDVTGLRPELLPVYNRAGGLAQVMLNGETYVREIAYSAKGQRVLIAYGNGVMTRYAYDTDTFRLLRLRTERYNRKAADHYQPVGEALQDFAYGYDLVGNILNIQDLAPASGILNNPDAALAGGPLAQLLASGDALVRRFEYDPIYRLLSATGRECDQPADTPPWLDLPRSTDPTRTRAYTQRYRYDPLGNMQQLQHQLAEGAGNRDFATVANSNRLDSVTVGGTVYRYAYDANGNMIRENLTRRFDWDHADRMKAFATRTEGTEPSVHAQYLYDAGGMRVKKLVRKQGGGYTVTVYVGGMFEHHRSVQGTEVLENNTLHVMDDQSRIALIRIGTPFPDDTTPAVKYHLGDHLGSSHVVIGGDGAWINREEYTPYGETSFGSFARKRYRFTGKERDEESGLNYHAARYYAAWLARWASCDPIGPMDGINTYSYTKSNPIRYVDRQGTDGTEVNASVTANKTDITGVNVRVEAKYKEQQGINAKVSTDKYFSLFGIRLQGAAASAGNLTLSPDSQKLSNISFGVSTAALVNVGWSPEPLQLDISLRGGFSNGQVIARGAAILNADFGFLGNLRVSTPISFQAKVALVDSSVRSQVRYEYGSWYSRSTQSYEGINTHVAKITSTNYGVGFYDRPASSLSSDSRPLSPSRKYQGESYYRNEPFAPDTEGRLAEKVTVGWQNYVGVGYSKQTRTVGKSSLGYSISLGIGLNEQYLPDSGVISSMFNYSWE
ncbi:MAG: RHS repeat-associated core domain-containing protein, partial [Gammaproteobacteria bacterium]